jgi:hypothetical protein
MTTELTIDKATVPAFVEDKLRATKEAVQAKAELVKQHLHKGNETAQDTAGEAAQQARSAANEALAKIPTAVSGRVGQLAGTARHRPVPFAAAMLSVVVLLVLRLVLRRNR